MKRRQARFRALGIMSIALWSAGPVAAQAPTTSPNQLTVSGPVRVIEADTLEVSIEGTRVVVGVAGIKAPPGNTACGREAIAAAAKMVAEWIVLESDPRLGPLDARHRRKYRVITPSGRSLAAELALAGLATAERSDANGLDYSDIVAAQAEAKGVRRGCLWSG